MYRCTSTQLRFRSHIFLCVSEKAKCASSPILERSWQHLKMRGKEPRLNARVGRTQANCLLVCKDGPVAVVFDHNGATWYNKCEPAVLDRILEEHCMQGNVVQDFQIAENTEFFKR